MKEREIPDDLKSMWLRARDSQKANGVTRITADGLVRLIERIARLEAERINLSLAVSGAILNDQRSDT